MCLTAVRCPQILVGANEEEARGQTAKPSSNPSDTTREERRCETSRSYAEGGRRETKLYRALSGEIVAPAIAGKREKAGRAVKVARCCQV